MHVQITTLFVGFLFSECNLIACGQGYNEHTYNAFRQCEIWRFETSVNALESTMCWNIQTHHFLKYYVSLRLKDRAAPRGRLQFVPIALTYLMSTIWHGIDAGYFSFFIGLALLDVLSRLVVRTTLAGYVCRKTNRSLLMAACWLWNIFGLSYFGMSFTFMDFSKFNVMHRALGHCLHILLPICIFAAYLLPKQQEVKVKQT